MNTTTFNNTVKITIFKPVKKKQKKLVVYTIEEYQLLKTQQKLKHNPASVVFHNRDLRNIIFKFNAPVIFTLNQHIVNEPDDGYTRAKNAIFDNYTEPIQIKTFNPKLKELYRSMKNKKFDMFIVTYKQKQEQYLKDNYFFYSLKSTGQGVVFFPLMSSNVIDLKKTFDDNNIYYIGGDTNITDISYTYYQ